MKEPILRLTENFVFFSGLVLLFRRLNWRRYRYPAKVLFGHCIINESGEFGLFLRKLGFLSSWEFEQSIAYLSKRYKFINPEEYSTLYFKKKKPEKPVLMLTFDDSSHTLYTNVLPVLKRYSVPAVVFVTTGGVGEETSLINDQLIYMIGKSHVEKFFLPGHSGRRYSIRNLSEKVDTFFKINLMLKKMNNEEKLSIIKELRDVFKIDIKDINEYFKNLSWDEIKEMDNSGLIFFGTHTVTHPILTKVPIKQAEYEIRYPKEQLEEFLDKDIKFFAYPNGSTDDYNEDIKKIVINSGYEMAFTTNEYSMDINDPYEIPRYPFEWESFKSFILKTAGFHDLVRKIIYHRTLS
jgi:peptidoglycan/xylan/chitin deacetylase (PgdA/CDA1 family)